MITQHEVVLGIAALHTGVTIGCAGDEMMFAA